MENIINSYDDLKNLRNDDAYYFYGENSYKNGWKMHLFLNRDDDKFPDLHDIRISNLSKYLIDNNLEHKFKNGNDGENTFCIYVGDRDKCEQIAKELDKKFGKEFSSLSKNGNNLKGSDFNFTKNIGIRFDGVNYKKKNSPFLRYGDNGVSTFLRNVSLYKSLFSENITVEKENNLKKLAAHVILAKYCGEKYLGKNYKQSPWDDKIFEGLDDLEDKKISTYISKCIDIFKPKDFIKEDVLVPDGQGVELNIPNIVNKNKPNNKLAQSIINKFSR